MLNNLLESGIFVNRADTAINGRWYYESDKTGDLSYYFPSVTSILGVIDKGDGFHRWLGNSLSYDAAMDYGNQAAKIGTIVHALVMELLFGEKVDTKLGFIDRESNDEVIKIDDRVNKRLMGFIQFIKDHKPNPLAVEMTLYNPAKDDDGFIYPWAGQVDQVLQIGGKNWLIDVKTGKEYKTHALQLTAYRLLWDSMFPQYKIDEMACLYLPDGWKKTPTYKLKKYKYEPATWLNALDMWNWVNKDGRGNEMIPKFRKDYETEFEITEELFKDKQKQKGEKNDTI